MEILLVATAVINTLLTAISISVAVHIRKKNVPYDDTPIRSALRQLDADIDDVFDRLRRLTSRKGMQAQREERSANPFARLPGETDAAWKARARKLRNSGVAPTTTEEV